MKFEQSLIAAVLGLAVFLGAVDIGEAQEADADDAVEMEAAADSEDGKWVWRSHIGTQFKTIDDKSGLMFAFSGDYRLGDRLTFGPYAFVSSSQNLVEHGWSLVARLPLEFGSFKISPFAGIGILKASFDMDSDYGFSSDSSGFAAPLGLSLQLNLSEATFYLTGMAIKHSLEFDVPPTGSGLTRTDPGSVAIMIGVGM